MPVLQTCSRVRFYIAALGSENDIHTVTLGGQEASEDGHVSQSFLFLPATMRTIDFVPRVSGSFILHSNGAEHYVGGEKAKLTVRGSNAACRVPSNAGGKQRTFYIAVCLYYRPLAMRSHASGRAHMVELRAIWPESLRS
jgi:hypothetical protein